MKICITGAHFTPAQATIEELLKNPGIEIIHIGRNHTIEGDKSLSVESQVLPKLGVKFIPIVAGRVRRYLSIRTFTSLLKIPVGFLQTFYILWKEKPSVVLSFGGYVGVPVVINAWLLNIPVIVHEQTLVSGLANRVSNFFADKIAVSFDKDYGFRKGKLILTGNPIRKGILEPPKLSVEMDSFFRQAAKEKKPVVLFTGGNQGAHTINLVVLEALEGLTNIAFVVHQTGDSNFRDFEALEEKRKTLKNPERYLPKKWLGEDMGGIFKRVDLVVSRSGANTLFELSYFGVPTLVIPLPLLYKDEQNENALFFKKMGLLEILPQSGLTAKSLAGKIKEMLREKGSLREQAGNARALVIMDAAKRLSQETLLLGFKDR